MRDHTDDDDSSTDTQPDEPDAIALERQASARIDDGRLCGAVADIADRTPFSRDEVATRLLRLGVEDIDELGTALLESSIHD